MKGQDIDRTSGQVPTGRGQESDSAFWRIGRAALRLVNAMGACREYWRRHETDWSTRAQVRSDAPNGQTVSDEALRRWIAVVLPVKVAIFAGVLMLGSPLDTEVFARRTVRWPSDGSPSLVARLGTWDFSYYLDIAAHGYAPGSLSNAFYPLWPGMLRALQIHRTAWAPLWSALLAALLWAVGCAVLYRWLATRVSRRAALTSVLCNLLLPSSIFFWIGYSESLFFLLTCLFLAGSDTQDRWLPFAAAFLLPLARPVGILLLALPVGWLLAGYQARRSLAFLACAVAGYWTYLGIMSVQAGGMLAGFDAQSAFLNAPSLGHLAWPSEFIRQLGDIEDWHHPTHSLLDRVVFIGALCCVAGLSRVRLSWCAWSAAMVIIPAFTNWFLSFSRFSIVIVPLVLIGAKVLSRLPRWSLAYYTLLSLCVQALLLNRHMSFAWAQ